MRTHKPIIIMLVLFSILQSIAQANLLAYWNFDELENNILHDYSENGNFATNYGATIVPGIIGNALYFDGINDYVRIPKDGQYPPPIFSTLGKGSISLWFKAAHIPTDYGIAPILYYGAEDQCNFIDAANQGLIIELGHSPIYQGSEAIFFTIWKNGCTYPSFCFDSRTAISKDVWHHYVVIVGDNYNTGYLDGVEMTGRWYSFSNSSDSQFFEDSILHEKMWLGKGYWDNTTQYFKGSIDELKIFDQPLTLDEVTELYNLGILAINEQESFLSNVSIYPNPTNDTIYIKNLNQNQKIETIELLNTKGQTVIVAKNYDTELYIGNLSVGIYFVRLTINDKSYLKKLIISD